MKGNIKRKILRKEKASSKLFSDNKWADSISCRDRLATPPSGDVCNSSSSALRVPYQSTLYCMNIARCTEIFLLDNGPMSGGEISSAKFQTPTAYVGTTAVF